MEFRNLQAARMNPGTPQEDADGPVFVDESGRRSKKFRRIGWVLALVCAGYAVTLVVALIGGNSNAPSLLIPGPADDKADTAEETPGPSEAPSAPAGAEVVAGVPSPSGSPADVPRQPAGSAGEPGGDRSGSPSGASGSGAATTGGAGTGGATTDPKPTVSTAPGGTGGAGNTGGTGGEEPPPDPVDPTPSETATEEPTGEPVAQGQQLAGEGAG
ncbi:hypothetical protein [Streptomyces sp. WMMC940]|uniref:hypothetical protein n=1 Tax=Streptomyces sp. WMMC940 TaxID=3015153 RepID=UPI0022B652A4|nr:hypothetical protein [Streptomyces sp. WMMC940]MCZ7459983.1 hypothetical protein [Streptomyces sp. WMMC940]